MTLGTDQCWYIHYDSQYFYFVPCLSAEPEAKEEEAKTGDEEKKGETVEKTEESTPSPEEKAQVEEKAEAKKQIRIVVQEWRMHKCHRIESQPTRVCD